MGIVRGGIFSGFSNKTGANVGRVVNGKNIVTGLYHPRQTPPSAAEAISSAKFAMLTRFLRLLRPLINVGFKQFTKDNTTLNAALKFNYPTGFAEDGGQFTINYPGITYSKGNVVRPLCLVISRPENDVVFSWAINAQSLYNRQDDKATFVIYNVNKGFFLFERSAAQRQELDYAFVLPPDFAGDELHCYMNFNAATGKLTGQSIYAGSV